MSSPIKHAVKVCETDPSIIEVYAGGHWPHLTLTPPQAINLWTQLGDLLAQPQRTVAVAELEDLISECSGPYGIPKEALRALIERAGGGL